MLVKKGLALLFLMALAGPAFSQDIPAIWPEGTPRAAKWRAFNGFAAGVNPMILGDMLKVYRAVPIFAGSNMLTRDAHLRFGGATTVSPYLSKIGPFVGISPLVILDFDFYWNQYLDHFHVSFDDLDHSYRPHVIAKERQYFYWGQNVLLEAQLKLAYEGVILVDIFDIEYFHMQDTWFCIELYTVIDDGWDYNNRLFLFYEFEPGWRVATMLESVRVLNTGLRREMFHCGFMADRKLPLDMSLVFLTGYHVINPDFTGFRWWAAVVKEWDL